MNTAALLLITLLVQRGGGPPPTAKAAAPVDLNRYWAAVITEDWHVRMLSAPKGDFGTGAAGAVSLPGEPPIGLGPNPAEGGSIPYKAAGGQAAMKFDPTRDEAEGNQCKAFGAIGVMRQPTHLHITWQDDNTLKLETDYGTQTRLFHFGPPPRGGQINFQSGTYVPPEITKIEPPAGTEPSWQGYSIASWVAMGGRGNFARGGSLQAKTTHLKPGYYWRNGMPYTGNAVLTEQFRTLDLPDGSQWLIVSQTVEDPAYLTQPFVVVYQFKKMPDGSKWNPTPCSLR
jgi:hypothetical protein